MPPKVVDPAGPPAGIDDLGINSCNFFLAEFQQETSQSKIFLRLYLHIPGQSATFAVPKIFFDTPP
jgi:hypothetical protein